MFVNANVEKLKYCGTTDLTDVPAIRWKEVKGKQKPNYWVQ